MSLQNLISKQFTNVRQGSPDCGRLAQQYLSYFGGHEQSWGPTAALCTTHPQPRSTPHQLTPDASYSSNKWTVEHWLTANSPDLHCYIFFILFQNRKPGRMNLFPGRWAKAFSVQHRPPAGSGRTARAFSVCTRPAPQRGETIRCSRRAVPEQDRTHTTYHSATISVGCYCSPTLQSPPRVLSTRFCHLTLSDFDVTTQSRQFAIRDFTNSSFAYLHIIEKSHAI